MNKFVATLLVILCACGGKKSSTDAGTSDIDAGIDAAECFADSVACNTSTDCCSGNCGGDNLCGPIATCTLLDAACADSLECCGGNQCLDDGEGGTSCQVDRKSNV